MKIRHSILFILIILLASCSSIRTAFEPEKTLKHSFSKPIGVAVDFKQLKENKAYRELVLKEYNSITPENALKMQNLLAKKGAYNFTQADYLLDFASENKLRFRAHPIIWHRQLPTWLAQTKKKEIRNIFETYIKTLVGHYKGKVYSWDVVNEAFLNNGQYRQSVWYAALGVSYIENAFIIAHREDPSAKLFYNDFGIEKFGPKFDAVYKLLKELKSKKIPVHGVGLQSHFIDKSKFNENELKQIIKKFSDLGLEVEITELDVGVSNTKPKFKKQAKIFSSVAKICSENPNCKGITLWGVADYCSWISKEIPGYGKATLYDKDMQMKKSLYYNFQKSLR